MWPRSIEGAEEGAKSLLPPAVLIKYSKQTVHGGHGGPSVQSFPHPSRGALWVPVE